MGWDALAEQADRACMLHLGGTPFLYAPRVGSPVTVRGIFDELYQEVGAGTDYNFNQTSPAVFFRLSDLPVDPKIDDPTITHPDGRIYKLKSQKRDGNGGVVIELERQT